MSFFAARLVEAVVKNESLGPLYAQSPFLVQCFLDHSARWEDIPDERKYHPRAVAARRHFAFLLLQYKLVSTTRSHCPLLGTQGQQ